MIGCRVASGQCVPRGTDRIINRFRHDTGDDSDQASISEYFFFP